MLLVLTRFGYLLLAAASPRCFTTRRLEPQAPLPPSASGANHFNANQGHGPGSLGLKDTRCLRFASAVVRPRLYHFRLAGAGSEHVHLVFGGGSFVALAERLQNALWALALRRASTASRSLYHGSQVEVTRRYQELMRHYDLIPTRNNLAVTLLRRVSRLIGPHRVVQVEC